MCNTVRAPAAFNESKAHAAAVSAAAVSAAAAAAAAAAAVGQHHANICNNTLCALLSPRSLQSTARETTATTTPQRARFSPLQVCACETLVRPPCSGRRGRCYGASGA